MDLSFSNIFTLFAAVVSVTMWIDYFRRIDVFEKEKTGPLLIALLVGCVTPYISLFNYDLLSRAGFDENGRFMNDLLYAVFGIGLNEELSKLIGVFAVFALLRKRINDPIDYLIYAGVTALGFSLVENYYYFSRHGVRIITSRTFYSALEHIINTSIIIYGIYRHRIFGKGNKYVNAIVACTIAIASHGLFDFFLNEGLIGYFTSFLSIIIYLVGINFWIQMLNNANNYSTFFDYDKVHFPTKIVYRLMYWYGLTMALAFVNNFVVADLRFAVITFFYSIFSDGFLFLVVILRVSRFGILRQNYLKVRIGLPFYITRNQDEDFRIFGIPIKIRGENHYEHFLTKYLHRVVEIRPVNPASSIIVKPAMAKIERKIMLEGEVTVYEISLESVKNQSDIVYILKAKTKGLREVSGQYPIHGLYSARRSISVGPDVRSTFSQLNFMEWVYLKV